MKTMSIIGIVLFSWLFFNRCSQYELISYDAGKTFTYTDEVTARAKHRMVPQLLVSVYALTYAICGTVYFFKKAK